MKPTLLGLSFAACSTPQVASVASWQVEEFEVRATNACAGGLVVAVLPEALRASNCCPAGAKPALIASM